MALTKSLDVKLKIKRVLLKLKYSYVENKKLAWLLISIVFVRSFLVSYYRIPSSSMNPILMEGDIIITDKTAYNFKVPFTGYSFKISSPNRGDVITFEHSSILMAKRVIAVSGDTVQLIKNKLYVNEQELTINTVVNTFVENKKFLKQKHFNYLAFREKNIDGIEYDVVYASGFSDEYLEQIIVDTRAFTVPKEKVFVIGDNRNLSIDSRYFGAISTKDISAKVIYIAFNYKEIWLYITGKLNHLRLWKSMG